MISIARAILKPTKIVLVDEAIQFSDNSVGDPTKWEWSFENGNPVESVDQNPEVSYSSPGNYTVSLIASNEQHTGSIIKENYITILSEISADFTISDGVIGQYDPIRFSDISLGNPTAWEWEFDGGIPDMSDVQNPTIIYKEAGNYNVTLIASNQLSSDSKTTQVTVFPTEGLLLHYPFNGNANDISGNGNDGIINGATLVSDRNGNFDKAYNFNGTGNQIKFPAISDFNNLPVSFSFWASFDQLNSVILGNDIVDNIETGVWFSVGQSAEYLNKLALNYGNGGGPMSTSRKSFVSDFTLETNKWYHIVGIIRDLNTIQLFVDGVEVTGTYTGSSTTYKYSGNEGSVGRAWDPNSFFAGKMDDIRIYNRILNSTEINILYNEK